MTGFWEESFQDKQMMWGEEPARAAVFARDFFFRHNITNILIPGIGYGRNAKPFLESGMTVAGIEISETAIELARKRMGLDITIYHGSVCDMPFDETLYDGVFCYAVIHLLDEAQREKLVNDCYNRLSPGGYMIFTAVSTKAPSYGQGTPIGANRFEQHGGVQIFFYDEESMHQEFGTYGLIEVHESTEPGGMEFLSAICTKQ